MKEDWHLGNCAQRCEWCCRLRAGNLATSNGTYPGHLVKSTVIQQDSYLGIQQDGHSVIQQDSYSVPNRILQNSFLFFSKKKARAKYPSCFSSTSSLNFIP